jgi:hypothetical protein
MCGGSARAFTGVEHCGKPDRDRSRSEPRAAQTDDLTFGQNAGKVLVGLTVRPAQPGPNTLLVYVLPLEGPAAAVDVPLSLAVSGHNVPLDTCSRTCRTANVTLTGGEYVDVVAGGASGGTAAFDLPALPAPDGTALLQQVQDRMHQLHTYRVDETLGPATPPLRAQGHFMDHRYTDFDTALSIEPPI